MPRARASVSGLRADNGENQRNTNGCQFYENDADAMRMMLWDEIHNKNKMQNNRQNPTTEEISYRISEKGKSWSYEYGKLYPGRYNTPPLWQDLIPGSRMAPEGKRRGR